MGKKGFAGSGKSTTKEGQSLLLDTKEDASLTGQFTNDMPLLCSQRGIPPVSVCKRGTCSQSLFCVIVENDDSDPELITALHMRGWLLTESIAALFSDALSSCTTLTAIHLWNVGLRQTTLDAVVQLSCEHRIRELTLDGNLLRIQPIITLLKQHRLEKLSMKNCGIDDEFVQTLSNSLTQNTSLLHLNLSCNIIGDGGCTALATSLRLNRTLLSLGLTCNHISDDGLIALAQTLSKFRLTHSEIVLKRKLVSIQRKNDESMLDIQVDKTRAASPHSRSPSSSTALPKGRGEKSSANKAKKGEPKKDEKLKKETKKGGDGKKGKSIKEGKTKRGGADLIPESPLTDSTEVTVNPLLDESQLKPEADGVYLAGNTNLIFLGLAYNEIGSAGMCSLLEALQVQDKYLEHGPGLLRVTLHHNAPRVQGYKLNCTPCKEILDNIDEILLKRNPDDSKELS